MQREEYSRGENDWVTIMGLGKLDGAVHGCLVTDEGVIVLSEGGGTFKAPVTVALRLPENPAAAACGGAGAAGNTAGTGIGGAGLAMVSRAVRSTGL